jgi:hypothetical protein
MIGMRRFSGLVVIIFFTVNCYAQPGDLTFPAPKITRVALHPPDTKYVLMIMYDGVNIFNQSFLSAVDRESINSIKTSRDSIFDSDHILKYQGIIEITTNDETNSILKYIDLQTGYWTKTYPLAVYYINEKGYSDDAEKLYELQNLKAINIQQIRTLNPGQGKELLGEAGKNGAILITTDSTKAHPDK